MPTVKFLPRTVERHQLRVFCNHCKAQFRNSEQRNKHFMYENAYSHPQCYIIQLTNEIARLEKQIGTLVLEKK